MDEDTSIFFDPNGPADDVVTFLPDEPGSEPFYAAVDYEGSPEYEPFREIVKRGCLLVCETMRTPGLPESSDLRDAPFEVNGKRYKFREHVSGDKRLHTLLLERDVRPTFK